MLLVFTPLVRLRQPAVQGGRAYVAQASHFIDNIARFVANGKRLRTFAEQTVSVVTRMPSCMAGP